MGYGSTCVNLQSPTALTATRSFSHVSASKFSGSLGFSDGVCGFLFFVFFVFSSFGGG
jgi:hypothetical protein